MTTIYDLHPDVTPDEVEAAHDATPVEFPDVPEQDNLDELGAGAVVPATPPQAIANARALTDNDVFVSVGMCLGCVRDREFRVPALYPDAETAWEEAFGKHPESDPKKIPRGAVPYWINGRHGHVALSVGGGLCRTTDYRRPGFVDLAPIGNLASWCGGRLVGWAEGLNGFDVWPDPKKPKPPPPPFGLADKERLVRHALERARKNKAPARRIDGLHRWHDHLVARLKESKS